MDLIISCFRRLGAIAMAAMLPLLCSNVAFGQNIRHYAVEVSANVQSNPAQIQLSWPQDTRASGYTVSRKAISSSSWSQLGTLGGAATSYTDNNVTVGSAYEYRIVKNASYTGYGYIYAGIQAPLVESRGKVLLLVDNTHATDLAPELARLQKDLIGDGWSVVRRDVTRSMTPPQVKAVIQQEWNADRANLNTVFIFGRVAVPYSGNFAVDGHEPDHVGAWPSDAYYADMDGNWTDNSVSNTGAHRPANHNVPGDGKFDQTKIPSDVELRVGRVDLYNMTCFSNKEFSRDEKALLRQYLNKDHNFRHRVFTLPRRGIVSDNFGERGGEAFAASGWRNFAPFFGAENVRDVGWGGYFPHVSEEGYLWSYGCGGGSYYTCAGVGGSDDFAVNDLKSVFTMYLGSYFGDWDNESNFLRAALGSTSYTLATAWAGRPHWNFHHMALGEPIGLAAKLAMNNTSSGPYPNQGSGTREAHIALLGDPTLRMHPVVPPANVIGAGVAGATVLTWTPSSDTDIVGYHVYRGDSVSGPFTRLTTTPVTAPTFTHNGTGTYMVRAVKLERSASGTYYNASQGSFWPDSGTVPPPVSTPEAPRNLAAAGASASQINLSWSDVGTETGYKLERKPAGGAYAVVATLGQNATSYSDTGLSQTAQYFYRVAAVNAGGQSGYSQEVSAWTTSGVVVPPAVQFLAVDSASAGSWKAAYGRDGHIIPNHSTRPAGYAMVTPSGQEAWTWLDQTSDGRCLERTDSGRTATCWFSANSYIIDLNLTDGQTHKVSLYALDWDRLGRAQKFEILDNSGNVLDSQSISGFEGGRYVSWNLKGQVRIRVTRLSGPNAAISGIFFDPAGSAANGNSSGEIAGGKFHVRINGQPGERYQIVSSSDLKIWSPVSTVTLSGSQYDYTDPNPPSGKGKFYRATRLP